MGGPPADPKARIWGKVTYLLGSETRKAMGGGRSAQGRTPRRGRLRLPARTGARPSWLSAVGPCALRPPALCSHPREASCFLSLLSQEWQMERGGPLPGEAHRGQGTRPQGTALPQVSPSGAGAPPVLMGVAPGNLSSHTGSSVFTG